VLGVGILVCGQWSCPSICILGMALVHSCDMVAVARVVGGEPVMHYFACLHAYCLRYFPPDQLNLNGVPAGRCLISRWTGPGVFDFQIVVHRSGSVLVSSAEGGQFRWYQSQLHCMLC